MVINIQSGENSDFKKEIIYIIPKNSPLPLEESKLDSKYTSELIEKNECKKSYFGCEKLAINEM